MNDWDDIGDAWPAGVIGSMLLAFAVWGGVSIWQLWYGHFLLLLGVLMAVGVGVIGWFFVRVALSEWWP